MGIFGNGVKIGIAVTKYPGCCGAGLGTTVLTSCRWLAATTTLRLMGATTADFDVCQDPITPEPHEVRTLQATKE